MSDPGRLLEIERELERTFASEEESLARQPKGWPAALIFFHIAQWRERLRNAMSEFEAGRGYEQPGNVDELNDRELSGGQGLPLAETAARADELLGALMGLSATLGDRPFTWTLTKTTGDALVRNSYFHPRLHLVGYWQENGDGARAAELTERTVDELRDLWPSPFILGAGLFNLATIRVGQGRTAEALSLLEEAAPMRPDILERARTEPELAPLRGNERFEALTARPPER